MKTTHEYGPFAAIVREDFTDGRSQRARQTVFGAWAAVDKGLGRYGYAFDPVRITPTTVKKTVGGDGKADKAAVAAGVRRLLRLADGYTFATGYDDSDAAAVCLTYLITQDLIDT